MNEINENYGDYFQQLSKYNRDNLPHHSLDWSTKPDEYKIYKNPLAKVYLPKPDFNENINFWNVIQKRHSTRSFSREPLTLMNLSLILFGMTGLTRIYNQFAFRSIPSAGGLYPIETYPIINNVFESKKGIYHYNILEHCLELLQEGDFRKIVSEACLGQRMAYNSAVNFIWTALIERSKWKYHQRCYRYIYLDCGHIGQNFYLIAEALGLGACTIGAIFDDELNNILNLNGETETAIYVGVLGKK
jgi:SagB-type dehydrogenase family enzyme